MSEKAGPTYVVAIGASAGGIEPLCELLGTLPEDLTAAIVIAVHRSPDLESSLDEVLRRASVLPVESVEGPTSLRPGHVYLEAVGHALRFDAEGVDAVPSRRESPRPIDPLFASMSVAHAERAIGIVLSGSGTDGGIGLREIKSRGGLVFVQDPDGAQFDGMPRHAIAQVVPDVVGPPEALGEALRRAIDTDVDTPLEEEVALPGDPLDRLLTVLRDEGGFDFRSYRRSTVRRRVQRRMTLAGCESLAQFTELMKESAREREALSQDLMINVTDFFRDAGAFRALDENVVLRLVDGARPGDDLRVWVPACSTGEEAYSIAILITRAAERAKKDLNFQIFATDLDARAIEVASQGFYGERIESRMEPALLDRFFHRVDGRSSYRVRRALRERMVFAVHDLAQDPPFTKMDLVSCRNLLIYFRPELQQHALRLLAYALKPRGYLFLGPSETPSGVDDLLDVTAAEARIYRRNAQTVDPPRLQSIDNLISHPLADAPVSTTKARPTVAAAWQARVAEQMVLRGARFALALDRHRQLVHVYGDAGSALRVPSGSLTTDIGALTRGEFRAALVSALQRVEREGEITSRAVILEGPHRRLDVELSVLHLGEAPAGVPSFVVRVIDVVEAEQAEQERVEASPDPDDRRIALQRELDLVQERLSNSIRDVETTNERLRLSNEELTSANEELQSTNEELHSANEELHVVNAESQERINELLELGNDLQNVLESSELGTVFLDDDLTIRRYTNVVSSVIRLMPRDVGRPLHHITHELANVDLVSLCEAVLESGEAVQCIARASGDRSILVRVTPFHDANGENHGVMLSVSDVTRVQEMSEELRISERRFRHVVSNLRQAVFLRRRRDLGIAFMSDHYATLLGLPEPTHDITVLLDRVHEDDRSRVAEIFRSCAIGPIELDFRIVRDDFVRWLHCSLVPTEGLPGEEEFDVGFLFDITRRKNSEVALHEEVARFEGFLNAMPDRFYWRADAGSWRALRAFLPTDGTRRLERQADLHEVAGGAAMRMIEEAAETARATGELQTVGFEDHGRAGSQSFEARLLQVEGQGTLCVLRDVSDLRRSERELQNLTRSLEQQANSDHLTRLPNRRGLEKVLFAELERCRRLGTRLSAILVDCDNFKRVNDTMGHATGDVVLQAIGKRLRGVLRPSDTLGRVGGDEFVVLLPDTRHAEAMALAERLRLSITGSPLTTGRDVIGLTGSLGVATIPQDCVSIEELISLTQHALAHSKRIGKNRVTAHDLSPGDGPRDMRDELLALLEAGKGFRTFAQPILDLRTGEIDGYELLTRGPVGSMENPDDIFQLSSENNILTAVDLHCVKRHVGWAREHLGNGRFHVNLFPSTILDTPAQRILSLFGEPDLLKHFCVEISEQQFIGDPQYLRPHVEELKRNGARIALDDVGFGRSSLESLLLLEPDTVKLDKSVVIGAARNVTTRRTLERLVGVIRGIDADIVAEGVETDEDRALLLDLGVEYGQGYLFGRPSETMQAAG